MTNILDMSQADDTFKSDMFVELVPLVQTSDEDCAALFDNQDEEKEFKAKMEQRFEALVDDTDEICFALDPHRSFLSAYADCGEQRRVQKILDEYMRERCMYDDKQRFEAFSQFRDFINKRGEFSLCDDLINQIAYWSQFEDLLFGKVALRLFHMITSEAAVERSFSMQKRFTEDRRNRLKQSNAEKLVAIAFSDMDNVAAKKNRERRKRRYIPDGEVKLGVSLLIGNEASEAKAGELIDQLIHQSDEDSDIESDSIDGRNSLTEAAGTPDHVDLSSDIPILSAGDVIQSSDNENEDDESLFHSLVDGVDHAVPEKRARMS